MLSSFSPPFSCICHQAYLLRRKDGRKFKLDGHSWKEKKAGAEGRSAVVREDTVNLTVAGGGRDWLLLGHYAHHAHRTTFHRRTYHINPAAGGSGGGVDEKRLGDLHVVHYLDEPAEAQRVGRGQRGRARVGRSSGGSGGGGGGGCGDGGGSGSGGGAGRTRGDFDGLALAGSMEDDMEGTLDLMLSDGMADGQLISAFDFSDSPPPASPPSSLPYAQPFAPPPPWLPAVADLSPEWVDCGGGTKLLVVLDASPGSWAERLASLQEGMGTAAAAGALQATTAPRPAPRLALCIGFGPPSGAGSPRPHPSTVGHAAAAAAAACEAAWEGSWAWVPATALGDAVVKCLVPPRSQPGPCAVVVAAVLDPPRPGGGPWALSRPSSGDALLTYRSSNAGLVPSAAALTPPPMSKMMPTLLSMMSTATASPAFAPLTVPAGQPPPASPVEPRSRACNSAGPSPPSPSFFSASFSSASSSSKRTSGGEMASSRPSLRPSPRPAGLEVSPAAILEEASSSFSSLPGRGGDDAGNDESARESKIRIVTRVVTQLERGRGGSGGGSGGSGRGDSEGEEGDDSSEDPLLDDAALTELGDGDLEDVSPRTNPLHL